MLLSELKVNIIVNILGTVSMFKSEPLVLEDFGASLDDLGAIHHLWAGSLRTGSSLEPSALTLC